MLLEELLDEELDITLLEGRAGRDVELGLVTSDLDSIAEGTGLAVDLDAVMQELLEVLRVEDVLLSRDGAVHSVFKVLDGLDGLLGDNLLGSGSSGGSSSSRGGSLDLLGLLLDLLLSLLGGSLLGSSLHR